MAARRTSYSRDSKYFDDWMQMAEDDLLAAKLLSTDTELFNCAAFHCQQSAEKILKAYLLFKTNQLVDGHNLSWLCRRAVKLDPRFDEWFDECAVLNHYYIETRYPSDFSPQLDLDTLNSALEKTIKLFNFVCDEIETVN